jgi:hypothetical protein
MPFVIKGLEVVEVTFFRIGERSPYRCPEIRNYLLKFVP